MSRKSDTNKPRDKSSFVRYVNVARRECHFCTSGETSFCTRTSFCSRRHLSPLFYLEAVKNKKEREREVAAPIVRREAFYLRVGSSLSFFFFFLSTVFGRVAQLADSGFDVKAYTWGKKFAALRLEILFFFHFYRLLFDQTS